MTLQFWVIAFRLFCPLLTSFPVFTKNFSQFQYQKETHEIAKYYKKSISVSINSLIIKFCLMILLMIRWKTKSLLTSICNFNIIFKHLRNGMESKSLLTITSWANKISIPWRFSLCSTFCFFFVRRNLFQHN